MHGAGGEEWAPHVIFGIDPLWMATALLILSYAVIITEKINRAIVAGVEHAGLLEMLAEKLLHATGGDMKVTAIVILWASAVFSAILDNIPFVATMIPLIKSTAAQFGGEQAIMPLWWALALGACLGGNGSLIGASANLTVAAFAEKAKQPIGFLKFMKLGFPIMLVTIAIAHVYLVVRFF